MSEAQLQFRWTMLWTIVIAGAHFALGTRTHPVHGLHILLGRLFLVPITMGAIAFGVRGGLVTAAAVGALYLAHILWSWRGSPVASADQYAIVGVYLVVGVVAGRLTDVANARKWQRDEVIRRSRESEMLSGLKGLLTAVGARDEETQRHSERVADLCEILAKRMELDSARAAELRLAGLVHDVGKVSLHDDVLFSNGSLTPPQRAEVNGHAETAARMVQSILGAERIAETVRSHHECPDGSGYPRGLKGAEISLDARILRVADVFAALSETRRYKESMPPEAVVEVMRPMAGSKIDRDAFAALEVSVREGALPAAGGDDHG